MIFLIMSFYLCRMYTTLLDVFLLVEILHQSTLDIGLSEGGTCFVGGKPGFLSVCFFVLSLSCLLQVMPNIKFPITPIHPPSFPFPLSPTNP